MIVTYFHLKNDENESQKRVDFLRQFFASVQDQLGISDEEGNPVGYRSPEEFKNDLKNLKSKERLWLLHYTQFDLQQPGLKACLEELQSDIREKIYLLLVSGDAIHYTDSVARDIELAAQLHFAGCTYLPIGLNANDEVQKKTLASHLESIQKILSRDKGPTFNEFHQTVHPAPTSTEKSLLLQLVKAGEVGERKGSEFAKEFFNRLPDLLSKIDRLGFVITEQDKVAFWKALEHWKEFESLRIRLRHSELSNLIQGLERVFRVADGKRSITEDPDALDRLCESIAEEKCERLENDLSELLTLAKVISNIKIKFLDDYVQTKVKEMSYTRKVETWTKKIRYNSCGQEFNFDSLNESPFLNAIGLEVLSHQKSDFVSSLKTASKSCCSEKEEIGENKQAIADAIAKARTICECLEGGL